MHRTFSIFISKPDLHPNWRRHCPQLSYSCPTNLATRISHVLKDALFTHLCTHSLSLMEHRVLSSLNLGYMKIYGYYLVSWIGYEDPGSKKIHLTWSSSSCESTWTHDELVVPRLTSNTYVYVSDKCSAFDTNSTFYHIHSELSDRLPTIVITWQHYSFYAVMLNMLIFYE